MIGPQHPTAFTTLVHTGIGSRTMYDRRVGWVQLDAYLFEASFSDGPVVEVQVNPEFGSAAAAEAAAADYLPAIGRLPRALHRDLQSVWLHMGDEAFGGGNRNLLIHTGALAQAYIEQGILEETLVHEATHTSLDEWHATDPAWMHAQVADRRFISTYARDYPTREDIAESFLPWLMLRLARDRIDPALAATIEATIPARLAYFDAQGYDLLPLGEADAVFGNGFEP